MRKTIKLLLALTALALLCLSASPANAGPAPGVRLVVASDTILSGMAASLLPPGKYAVEAILPPGQCPGHYDVKLSDIEKTKNAELVIAFRGMPFMETTAMRREALLLVDAGDRNWMTPDSYVRGISILAERLAERFPADGKEIMKRKRETTRAVMAGAKALGERLRRAGLSGRAVIASSMQKEPLVWMGFRVAAEYGRPESLSAREVVRLVRIGRERNALLVADNLQSGPDTGKGIAEALGTPHVVLSNFPSEKGYLTTLGENVESVLAAARAGKK
jgi:zinc transport system substrate-binding protein